MAKREISTTFRNLKFMQRGAVREEIKPDNGNFSSPVINRKWPTMENLVPIRLDIEIDGHHFKDAFCWNPSDPDSEVVFFAKRTAKDLKLPPAFVTQIAQSIQSQLADFRSYEGQDVSSGEKIIPIKLDLQVNHTLIKDQFLWDLNNIESDPEDFALTFCKDLGIQDPEVAPAVAFAIREELYKVAIQNVATAKENRLAKKGRRGFDYIPGSKAGSSASDLMKLFGNRYSMVRKRKNWDAYEPIVDILSNEEVEALEATKG